MLTQEAAKAAGLPLDFLNYTVQCRNREWPHARRAGHARPRQSRLASIERAVPALIAQPGQLRTSLLGMSFLNRLKSWEVRGDRLLHARQS